MTDIAFHEAEIASHWHKDDQIGLCFEGACTDDAADLKVVVIAKAVAGIRVDDAAVSRLDFPPLDNEVLSLSSHPDRIEILIEFFDYETREKTLRHVEIFAAVVEYYTETTYDHP